MSVIAEKNEVRVVSEMGDEGETAYRVFFRDEEKLVTLQKSEALDLFSLFQPVKAVCGKCKQIDLVSFPGRLGVGRFRMVGDGGWEMERVFGGLKDYSDVILCPECAEKSRQEYAEYLRRR